MGKHMTILSHRDATVATAEVDSSRHFTPVVHCEWPQTGQGWSTAKGFNSHPYHSRP